eukprot:CAMPEP_0113830572 /NCGR_PEP_ID=MMETSP0328-20130328/6400_1 /TAXON_ID=39455 /ORGANISM="Alexandrium minutum" /LENGTH=68 /DNA_ID=CAMNT_0000798693 /DNA_START=123 /DNA_END=326 /DNA_ORIENTATION=- /assembly_acc=CAM_ASM_000350
MSSGKRTPPALRSMQPCAPSHLRRRSRVSHKSCNTAKAPPHINALQGRTAKAHGMTNGQMHRPFAVAV